jgi:hypothetical protein
MKVGFTGTQRGMKPAQLEVFAHLLQELKPTEFHHGDCVGADEEAHDVAAKIPGCVIHVHPPRNPEKRAFCMGDGVIVHPEKTYLLRNTDIVEACETLMAAPWSFTEVLRSGTWATIRKGRTYHRMVKIIYPDGKIK